MKFWVKTLTLIAAIIGCLTAHAQFATINTDQPPAPDSIIQITAEAQGLPLMSRDSIPRGGTFWLFMPDGGHAPLPCPMILSNYPIYAITGNQYIMDGTGGQVTPRRRPGGRLVTSEMIASALEAQAQAVIDLITSVLDTQLRQAARALGFDVPATSERAVGTQMMERQSGVPFLTVTPTNGTQLVITVLNDTNPGNYDWWWTPVLVDQNYPWILHTVGSAGQTNFVVNMVSPTAFFRAVIGSDADGDGVPNSQDGDPNNPAVGILTITIDSPLAGIVFN